MNYKLWQDREGHPPADVILLHLDGEVEEPQAARIRLHIEHCAACQKTCDQLNNGMLEFQSYRDNAALPAPEPHADVFLNRLAKLQKRNVFAETVATVRKFFAFSRAAQLTLILGSSTIALIAFVFFFLGSPRQSVYASQILDEARKASDSLVNHSKVLNQRVRLRRGPFVVEKNVHHGVRATAGETAPATDLQQALELAHVDWNDPLNAADFAAWRAAQPNHTDTVKETSSDLTITIHVKGSSITEGSLTLSRSDFRPIARSVEFQNQAPIEIAEVSYQISDLAPVLSESASSASPVVSEPTANIPASHQEPSPIELEASELGLREAVHSIGADVSAPPEIWHSEHTVYYRASSENANQISALRAAAARIPFVKEGSANSAPPQHAASGSGPYTPTSLLVTTSAAASGNANAASDLATRLSRRSTLALAEAAALDRLARRYPLDAVKALPPDLQNRINCLAASQLSALQHDASAYIQSLSPVLDSAAQSQSVSTPPGDVENAAGCLHWQESAALAAPHLRTLEQSTYLLFGAGQTGKQDGAATDKLIADSLKERSFLEQHLISTCQLFVAH